MRRYDVVVGQRLVKGSPGKQGSNVQRNSVPGQCRGHRAGQAMLQVAIALAAAFMLIAVLAVVGILHLLRIHVDMRRMGCAGRRRRLADGRQQPLQGHQRQQQRQ